ncbi:DUF664 domain-containing protein [SAR202 cluster bacterium AD-802-E10_MRT_200m]|nr:DUF664 domain-containing protein [SAR202 cluster bacterium AD-802-E10_MRT_200m]
MDTSDVLIDAYGRIQGVLVRTLTDLNIEELCFRPKQTANSIAWLAWHLTRVQDHHISSLMEQPQLWVSEGWHKHFNMPPESENIGAGHTLVEVGALVPPDGDTLLAYHNSVFERTKAFVRTLSQQDLDRELNEPQYTPLPTVGVRLISVISDNSQHAGQAAYLKGIIRS